MEKAWPTYLNTTNLVAAPEYLRSGAPGGAGEAEGSGSKLMSGNPKCAPVSCEADTGKQVSEEGRTWLQEYLGVWVQRGQEFRQNHVHQWNKRLQRGYRWHTVRGRTT